MADAHVGKLALGGWGGGIENYLVGTVKDYRYYDRILTREELVRNRNVDGVRYFGALAVTNVVVEMEAGSGIVPAEPADEAYFVEGSHTFTATGPAGLGYRILVPDENGDWQTLGRFDGGAYAYTSGDSPSLMKLEWRVTKPFVIMVR